ncbi:(2Fe-2S)-binding protein [Kitasatospora sp. NPDC059571]|uniref:(2Fe-2S)-binding protein n=1 Tax=Kitasatospora sp. NPDC059571 TaxID=3346871 RepID=UPI003697FCB3
MTPADDTPVTPGRGGAARPLLERAGRLGPYFAVRGGTGDGPPPDGFRPLRELYGHGADGPLARRIADVGRLLGTDEPRVAASTVHLGLAARLWSVALGPAVLGGAVPDLDPDRVHWALPPQGPLDLWLPQPPAPAAGPLADRLHRAVLAANLAPLADAVRAYAPVAPGLLAGNAASALVGTVRVLAAAPGTAAEGVRTAAALVRDLLGRPPLRGAGGFTAAGGRFRRTSCCLYYRVPGGGVCGDCVFDRPPARRR